MAEDGSLIRKNIIVGPTTEGQAGDAAQVDQRIDPFITREINVGDVDSIDQKFVIIQSSGERSARGSRFDRKSIVARSTVDSRT